MKKAFSEPELLHDLGKKITSVRLDRNLTQAELSNEAGISKRTLERLEAGESIQLASFIRILRTLGYLKALHDIFPEPVVSPIAQLQLQKKQRQRASKSRSSIIEEAPTQWTWNDQQ